MFCYANNGLQIFIFFQITFMSENLHLYNLLWALLFILVEDFCLSKNAG